MRRLAGMALAMLGCSGGPNMLMGTNVPVHAWLTDDKILVQGYGVTNTDCRGAICQHNENTDLVVWNGATWLVHRTAKSQILGDDSALHVYRSTDHGAHFTQTALLPALTGRDIRDPHWYIVNGALYLKALTRLPVTSARDSFVETQAVGFSTTDGVHFTQLPDQLAPTEWSLWRIKQENGVYYSAGYHDGDTQVALFSSTDGAHFTQGADIYTVSDDTPLETELVFFPSGALLALVRTDGTSQEWLGSAGRLRTQICWAQPPYDAFTCPAELDGQRLDGPLALRWQDRVFVVARKHLGADDRKRTSLFELGGDFSAAGALTIREWGELPSAGDTSYAGLAAIDDHRVLVTWYSGDLVLDQSWAIGMLDSTDIWQGTIDLSKLK